MTKTVPLPECVRAARPWADWALCLALMLVAAGYRLDLLATLYPAVDADQSVLGLMAYHVQAGQHPVFYAGQPYMGSLEAYLAAAVFAVAGAGDVTLRLPASPSPCSSSAPSTCWGANSTAGAWPCWPVPTSPSARPSS